MIKKLYDITYNNVIEIKTQKEYFDICDIITNSNFSLEMCTTWKNLLIQKSENPKLVFVVHFLGRNAISISTTLLTSRDIVTQAKDFIENYQK